MEEEKDSPKLQSQDSLRGDLSDWHCSRQTRTAGHTQEPSDDKEEEEEEDDAQYHKRSQPSVKKKLQRLWSKVKEKTANPNSRQNMQRQGPYDLDSYAKNFDDGSVHDDPDYACSSFSARFAPPRGASIRNCDKSSDSTRFSSESFAVPSKVDSEEEADPSDE